MDKFIIEFKMDGRFYQKNFDLWNETVVKFIKDYKPKAEELRVFYFNQKERKLLIKIKDNETVENKFKDNQELLEEMKSVNYHLVLNNSSVDTRRLSYDEVLKNNNFQSEVLNKIIQNPGITRTELYACFPGRVQSSVNGRLGDLKNLGLIHYDGAEVTTTGKLNNKIYPSFKIQQEGLKNENY